MILVIMANILEGLGVSEIVIAIISAIGAGGLTFILGLRKNKRDDFNALISTWEKDNLRLREEVQRLDKRIQDVELMYSEQKKKADNLQTKLILLQTAHQDLPFPQWLKDIHGNMLALNRAYEDMFLRPNGLKAEDYIGKTDFDIWPEEIAKEYEKNDMVVKTGRQPYWVGEESIMIADNDISKEWKVIKYGRFMGRDYNNRPVCVGIAGMAIPLIPD